MNKKMYPDESWNEQPNKQRKKIGKWDIACMISGLWLISSFSLPIVLQLQLTVMQSLYLLLNVAFAFTLLAISAFKLMKQNKKL